jgi:hypothetical protein
MVLQSNLLIRDPCEKENKWRKYQGHKQTYGGRGNPRRVTKSGVSHGTGSLVNLHDIDKSVQGSIVKRTRATQGTMIPLLVRTIHSFKTKRGNN